MAALNELIQKIENPELRAQIQAAADRLTKQKKFGLVFEDHLPECTPLYDIPVRKGTKVSLRNGKTNKTYTVLKVSDGKALCLPKNGSEAVEFDISDLVTTAELGDPIYPCLQPLGEVCNAPDSELWHTLIEADNYHALQLLEYLYAGKVDCIYIDPPYNTGAKDWKYNNDYVDSSDEYRHSKWLSFMQKRLEIAKRLLNPADSLLIVAIDDKEYHHLACLLEDMFSEAKIQMVSTVMSPAGVSDPSMFNKTNEFLFYVFIGDAAIVHPREEAEQSEVDWWYLHRRDYASRRGAPKGGTAQFYPIYVNNNTKRIEKIGDPITPDIDRFSVPQIPDCTAVFPIRADGTEMNWGLTPDSLQSLLDAGAVRVSEGNHLQQYIFRYLSASYKDKVSDGIWEIVGTRDDGSIIVVSNEGKVSRITTVWSKKTHVAKEYGTGILKKIIGNGKFTYPKSLYAVADSIRYYLADKPNALVVDFFAGSGTTLHAINLINLEDSGSRRCIMVTNNEISDEERKAFEAQEIKPGDEVWNNRGIARYVTWPRTVCSIRGTDLQGKPLNDHYFSVQTQIVQKKRSVTQISYIDQISTISLQDKKKLVSLISHGVLPGKLVDDETAFVVSEETKHTVSILLDETKFQEWIQELEGMNHIQEFFIISKDKKQFNAIKKLINNMFEPLERRVPLTIPMADGFKANAVFFKLGFLDKTKVSLGMQFKELLSTLWMKAGAIGKCPVIDASVPDMLILPDNKMAILNDENQFGEFAEQLAQHPEIDVVYLVTDYESSFVAMTQVLEGKKTYQLYRDYLDNFRINAGRNSR